MSHHCHCDECSASDEHHHDHSCCCKKHSHSCESHSSGCHEDFSQHLLDLADDAWMEVLKEKIKDQIREKNGGTLDEMAKLVAESNNSRWKGKLCLQNTVNDFKAKLENLLKK